MKKNSSHKFIEKRLVFCNIVYPCNLRICISLRLSIAFMGLKIKVNLGSILPAGYAGYAGSPV